MALERIESILMKRDGMAYDEAMELIEEAKEAVSAALESGDFIAVEHVCQDYFGLEPDYVWQLID